MSTQGPTTPIEDHPNRGLHDVALLPAGYFSISDAARILGKTPGNVADLIDDGHIETVQLIRADSLEQYRQRQAS